MGEYDKKELEFYCRRKRNRHGDYFGLVDKGVQKVVSLVKTVFEHHRAVFDAPGVLATGAQLPLDVMALEQEQWVHALFYAKYYVEIGVFRGPDPSEERNRSSVEEFCDSITCDYGPDHNEIFYLLGSMGCGKTAFLNRILSLKAHEWRNRKNLLFVRISGFDTERRQVYSCDETLHYLMQKTIRIIDGMKIVDTSMPVQDAYYRLRKATNEHICERTRIFVDLIRLLRSSLKLHVLFVIENMDYIFYVDDTKVFYPDFVGCSVAHTTILDVVNWIRDKDRLGRAGANFLLVLRSPSYAMLRSTFEKKGESDYGGGRHMDEYSFVVAEPAPEDAVQSRLEMIKEVRAKYLPEGAQPYIEPVVAAMTAFITSGDKAVKYEPRLMDVLPSIASFKLRDIMTFCAIYAWIYGVENAYERGIQRFLEHFHAGLIAFILRGQKRYSQNHTQFPNVFLTAQPGELHPQIQQREPNGFPNYYWLKRLLMEYIRARDMGGRRVATVDIMRVFADGDDSYPRDVVCHALTSLTRTHGSNILDVEAECFADMITGDAAVSLTPRGVYCLEKVFDEFVYFQLVVDDYELPIPCDNDLFSLFKYGERDYSYLVRERTEYGSLLKELVVEKATLVSHFLEILKCELEYERSRYSSTFQQLEGLGIGVDVGMIGKRVEHGIAGILDYLGMNAAEVLSAMQKETAKTKAVAERLYNTLRIQVEPPPKQAT